MSCFQKAIITIIVTHLVFSNQQLLKLLLSKKKMLVYNFNKRQIFSN